MLLISLALAGSYERFVEEVSTTARAWSEPEVPGTWTGPTASSAWQELWLAAGPNDEYAKDGSKRKGDNGVRRALRRAWDPTLPKARKLSGACVELGWPATSDDPVIARVDAPTCVLLQQHKALKEDWAKAAGGTAPRNPATAFDVFLEEGDTLRSTYPLRSMARSMMLLGWADGDPITPAGQTARLGWDLTLGGDPSVTMSGLGTLGEAYDVLKGYAFESDAQELQRIVGLTEELAQSPVDLEQLARSAYLASVTLMLRATDPKSQLIAHGTVSSRRAPLGSLGDLDGIRLPIRQFLKGPHREAWEKAFVMVQQDFTARQQGLRALAKELADTGGPIAALVGAAASSEIEALARWDAKIMLRRQENCLLGAAAKQALGQELGSCPLGLQIRDDGLYASSTPEEFSLTGRWVDAFSIPHIPPVSSD